MLADHFEALERVHEERFDPTHGPLRRAAVGRFLSHLARRGVDARAGPWAGAAAAPG